jgi:putative heme-binding domain-containing protein
MKNIPSLTRRVGMVLVFALLPVAPAFAQRDAKVPDPDPELERKTFILANGFEANLWAADPLLAKPIQMNFDAAGRLWVACSESYPQIKPGAKQNDKVIILEDTKGAGKADKVTIFADDLLIPTGVLPGDGGVYVADSTDLVHFSEPDKSGKATKRRVILSGFGTEDTHHIIHAFRWGPDGLFYFSQSVYIHSHIETPYGVRRLNGGGVWQFRPESRKLEVLTHGLWNSWGTTWDRYGQPFLTDGAGGEGVNVVIPGAYYASYVGAPKILPGLNPGSPKYCGAEIVSGRHLPADWQGNLVTHDFRGHRVCRFVLSPDGSGWSAKLMPDLVKSDHPAFRPVDVKMGPDGAIYVLDWYNPIIQHGEVDFRDPRRDVTHGRIWRITVKDRPLVPRPKLVGATVEDLLETFKLPEDHTRILARRVLRERGKKEVEPALAAWVKKLDPSKADDEVLLLEALWTYQALDVVEPKLLGVLLHAKDHRIRQAAVRVLSMWHDRLDDPLKLLAERVADDEPHVRLEAVRALGRIGDVRAAELALSVMAQRMDRFLDYGLFLTCRDLQPQWLPAVQQGKFNYGNDSRRLLFALQAVGSPAVVGSLVDLVKQKKVPADGEEGVLTLIATLGNANELNVVFDRAIDKETPERLRVPLLAALEQAAVRRNVKPYGDLTQVASLLKTDSDAVRAGTARLIGVWKLDALRGDLMTLATSSQSSEPVSTAAFDGLVALGGPQNKTFILGVVDDPKAAAPVRRRALSALTVLDLTLAAGRVEAILALSPDGVGAEAVFDAFIGRKGGPEQLTKALDGKKLTADAAKVGVRQVRASGRDLPALTEALSKAGGLGGPLKLTAKEVDALAAEVLKKGDPARGELIFRRKDMLCFKCHALGGSGGLVGPDLSGIGASAQVDYLIDSLLEPNKAVKENYHAISVITTDGRITVGIQVRRTDTELVLRNAEDKEITIPRNKIESTSPAPSLMPSGLVDHLTRAELTDLVRFLVELGKVGPYTPGPARLVRRWQVLDLTPASKSTLIRPEPAAIDNPALSWTSAYATAAGVLPLSEQPVHEVTRLDGQGKVNVIVLRCQIDVSTAGKVRLRCNDEAALLGVWLGGKSVSLGKSLDLDLPAGVQTVTFVVEANGKANLRVELEDVPGSGARARLVGGK